MNPPIKRETVDYESTAPGRENSEVTNGSQDESIEAVKPTPIATPRFYDGQPHQMGQVSALPQTSFEKLCEDVLCSPIPLSISREDFTALPKKEQNSAKRVRYIVPATFTASSSKRVREAAQTCNLIALDVDDPRASVKVIKS